MPSLTTDVPRAVDKRGETPGAPEEAPALRLTGVTKRWQSAMPPVLSGLDLSLAPGTTTWVGGRNGVGKTTMLRVAAGLIYPDEGGVEVWGMSPQAHRERYQRLVSFLPAGDRGLYARLTVRRQLEFWARISMVPRTEFSDAIDRTIETFALGDLAGRRVDRMSMGQRQRLRIAMTFLPAPQVVLLDEPLTSLDEIAGAVLAAAVTEVTQRGGAVLWCSPSGEHVDVDFAARWLLEGGRLVRT
jgi:ABC-type multidrug transport system ATPase subunit